MSRDAPSGIDGRNRTRRWLLHLRSGMNAPSHRCKIFFAAFSLFAFAASQLSRASAAADSSAEKRVTFNKDLAPVVFRACAPCHHPGEAAPFSLLTYGDAKSHARQIADLTEKRVMPPWLPEPGEGNFTGKGLYDVDTFQAALADRDPQRQHRSRDEGDGRGRVAEDEHDRTPDARALDRGREARQGSARDPAEQDEHHEPARDEDDPPEGKARA